MATWLKQDIILENGSKVSAQAPMIVSASRSTDIPAFYAGWFLHRLKNKEYSAWTNPFNGVKSYVTYSNTHFIVFWSKNPRPLIESGLLDYLDTKGINYYIQYTLNDYEKEGLEKGVLPLDYRIETFKMLVERIGTGKVIWRFDPLILTKDISIESLLNKVSKVGDSLCGFTEKMVFSFVDILEYGKVKGNLEKNGIDYRLWTSDDMDEFASRLAEINRNRGWNYRLATCGEKIDIEKYGIEHNRCIDGDLITRIAWKDKELMKFMKTEIHELAPTFFDVPKIPADAIKLDDNHYFFSSHKMDPGQRALCGCMAAKDIGEYNTCIHLCEYCYANTSKESAKNNFNTHLLNKYAETITGR